MNTEGWSVGYQWELSSKSERTYTHKGEETERKRLQYQRTFEYRHPKLFLKENFTQKGMENRFSNVFLLADLLCQLAIAGAGPTFAYKIIC